jgi:prophage tail gpP-like protein
MNELSLKISGQKFDFWNNFQLNLVYNSLSSTFSFDGLVLTPEQKKLFKPLSYHSCQVLFNNEVLLTGTILNTSTSVDNNICLGNITGYSKPGVLGDCEIPISLYPLQFDNMSLKEITEKLITPFGLKLSIDSSLTDIANKKYDTIAAEPEQTINDFLTKLCKTKNIILTHNEVGNVVFARHRKDDSSVATYIEGKPSTNIKLSVNGQAMHSEITGQKQASIGTDVAGEVTIQNDYIPTYRPTTKKQDTGKNDDTENSVNMIRGSELRGIQLTIETDRYKWFDGRTMRPLRPNHTIDVESPSNFITDRTRFFVESVEYTGNQEGIKAVIHGVLPECYSGEVPKIRFS